MTWSSKPFAKRCRAVFGEDMCKGQLATQR